MAISAAPASAYARAARPGGDAFGRLVVDEDVRDTGGERRLELLIGFDLDDDRHTGGNGAQRVA